MSKPNDPIELERRVQSLRKKMLGVRSDGHWLNLRAEVRLVLEEALAAMSIKRLAAVLVMPLETVEAWQRQRAEIGELRRQVDAMRSTLKAVGRKNLSVTTLIRPAVAALSRFVSLRTLADVLGVPRTTIVRWQKDGWDKVDVGDLVGAAASQTLTLTVMVPEPVPAVAGPPKEDLLANAEARELAGLLARHEGKVRRKYSLTERKLILAVVERFGSKVAVEQFGVSYDTIARLRHRASLDLERRIRMPVRYAPVIDLMKRHPGMGPMQIRDYLKRHMGLSMGVNSIRHVMELNGWVPPFVRSPRIKEEMRLYEAVRRNYLWHMDFKHQYINKCKVFVLFIQDDFSRFVVGHAVADGEKIEVVLQALDEAIRIHGKPEVVMTDGGSAFYSWRGVSQVTRFFEDYGVDQHVAKTPNVNGKLENLNQQVEKELLLTVNFASLAHFEKELASWVAFYNFRRPHQGLGDTKVPADRYYPGAHQWYGENSEIVRQQSLIAETMATLLGELKRPK
jgi:transposase InsO family protein